jgi:hypothetical protein
MAGGGNGPSACGPSKNQPCGALNSPWPNTTNWYTAITNAEIIPANQYGRTSFLFAGLPGMQLPVSFAQPNKTCRPNCLSVYEQAHNASLFSLYLPIANEADFLGGRLSACTGMIFTIHFL